jgi:putative selenium metabolism hydrolase
MTGMVPDPIIKKSEKYRDYAARTLSELVRIRSFSGKEEAAIKFLENEFMACGANEVSIDTFGNLLARMGSRGPVIAFDGHVDTVDVGQQESWSFDPFGGEIKNGRVYGRGAADQKAGIAAMLAAMKIISETTTDLPFTLFFVGSVLEEDCDGLCWQYIINEDKIIPDIVILTEPTDGKINRGHRGRMEMEVVVTGVASHGSAPERGQNAIYRLVPIITAVEKLNERLIDDPVLGRGTLAATKIQSSAPSLNAIADMACVYLDRRLTRGETPEGAMTELSSLPEVLNVGARVTVPAFESPSWRGTTYPALKTYQAWILPEEHHLIDYAARCHQRLFGSAPTVGKWLFSTNGVATMGISKIPTFGYGPGSEEMAHARDESVAIDDVVRCAAFYAYFPWVVVGQ